MRGQAALMTPSSFRLCAPGREARVWKGVHGWCFPLDDLPALRACLRETAAYMRSVWSPAPGAGLLFGPGGRIWSRRGQDFLELISPHFSLDAVETDHLELTYTDLAAARCRLVQQATAIRRTQRRKASHDVPTHQ